VRPKNLNQLEKARVFTGKGPPKARAFTAARLAAGSKMLVNLTQIRPGAGALARVSRISLAPRVRKKGFTSQPQSLSDGLLPCTGVPFA
jgi:hypothetical protein